MTEKDLCCKDLNSRASKKRDILVTLDCHELLLCSCGQGPIAQRNVKSASFLLVFGLEFRFTAQNFSRIRDGYYYWPHVRFVIQPLLRLILERKRINLEWIATQAGEILNAHRTLNSESRSKVICTIGENGAHQVWCRAHLDFPLESSSAAEVLCCRCCPCNATLSTSFR